MVTRNAKGPATGSAGRQGPEVRSDCRVTLQPLRSGGLALSVRSKVTPYYGEAIDEQLRAALKALGVRHARVELEDAGALPFVLAARLEAAARRAGVAGGDARPPRLAPDAQPRRRATGSGARGSTSPAPSPSSWSTPASTGPTA